MAVQWFKKTKYSLSEGKGNLQLSYKSDWANSTEVTIQVNHNEPLKIPSNTRLKPTEYNCFSESNFELWTVNMNSLRHLT